MKTFFQEYLDENATVQYCPYCLNLRGEKMSCCGEVHFIELQEMSTDEQLDIIQSEYKFAFGDK